PRPAPPRGRPLRPSPWSGRPREPRPSPRTGRRSRPSVPRPAAAGRGPPTRLAPARPFGPPSARLNETLPGIGGSGSRSVPDPQASTVTDYDGPEVGTGGGASAPALC